MKRAFIAATIPIKNLSVISRAGPRYHRAMQQHRMAAGIALATLLVAGSLAWDRYGYLFPIEELCGPPEEPVTQSIYVHDGDTIRIGSERIRIIGLDTPEIGSGARCPAEQQGAVAARAELERMLFRAKVTIRRDGTDRYGRTLAYVYADGENVARALISAGLARPYQGGKREGWCE